MITASLCLLQTPDHVSFAGGTATQFVRAMARQGVGPVAVFGLPNERYGSFGDAPRSAIRSGSVAKALGTLAYGDALGFSSRELPMGFLMRAYYADYVRGFGERAKVAAQDGKITVKEGTSPWVRVDDLVALPLKRKLKVHWTYASAFVAITPGAWSEDSLLRAVSDAVGAKWSATPDAISLEFDPRKHRERAANSYADAKWKVPMVPFEYTRPIYAAAAAVSDGQWALAYKSPTSECSVDPAPDSSGIVLKTRLALRNLYDFMIKTHQDAQAENIQSSIDRINQNAKGRILLYADGRIFGEVQLGDTGNEWFSFG